MQPIIVAAMPISDKMDTPELLILLEKIVFGLLNAGISIISYACDGTETERKVQRSFTEKADSYIRLHLLHLGSSDFPIEPYFSHLDL